MEFVVGGSDFLPYEDLGAQPLDVSTLPPHWEFLKDFPDAEAFARASLEVGRKLHSLQLEQERAAKAVSMARQRLDEFETGLAKVRENVLSTESRQVLDDICGGVRKDLSVFVEEREAVLNGIQAKLDVFYDVTGRIKRAVDPERCGECIVCMKERVRIVLIPCGHCICSGCFRDRPLCHYCRSPVESSQRIFL